MYVDERSAKGARFAGASRLGGCTAEWRLVFLFVPFMELVLINWLKTRQGFGQIHHVAALLAAFAWGQRRRDATP